MRRSGLRTKVVITLVIFNLLMFSGITLVLVRQYSNTLRNSLLTESKSFAALATKPIGDTYSLNKDSGQIRIQQQVDSFLELDSNITDVAIVDVAGKPLFDSSGQQKTFISSRI